MRNIIFLLLLAVPLSSYAQYFNYGQSRGSIEWKKIESSHFEIIYPEGFDAKALKILHMMEDSRTFATKSLNHEPKKVSLVLHTETVKSNAFLGWAPSRIEMFTTPHQGVYSKDWLEQLAIHEYRHMVQLSKIESEMPRLLKWLFGEQAAAAITAAYLPFWFIEGDAVAAETALSTAGRGRMPDFHRQLRTQLIEYGKYSYDKAYLGSYKNNVANYYQMGYFLTAGAREMYNKVIWDEVMEHVASKPFSTVAFNKGLKNSIGMNKTMLYDTVFSFLKEQWKIQDSLLKPTPHIIWPTKEQKYFTNYQNVLRLNNSTIIAERSGLQHVNSLVSIDSSGKEKKLFTPGRYFRHSLTSQNYLVIWSERLPNLRWEHAERSLLRIYNSKDDKLVEFKYKTKLFSPAISPNLQYIAAIEADNNYEFHILIIDLENGNIIKRIENPENDFIITPSWSADSKSIYAVLLRNNQKALAQIDAASSALKILLPFSSQEILKPVEYENGVLFIGGYTGIDNIYYLSIEENALYSVIESRFGISDYTLKKDELLFSNYTSDGFRPALVDLSTVDLKKVELDTIQSTYPIAEAISKQEPGIIQFTKHSDIDYRSEKYKRAQNVFNFHSWAPVSIDPYRQTIQPGISAMSQNMLGTAEFTTGYRYKTQQKYGEIYANAKYMGLFPIFEAEIKNSNQQAHFFQITQYRNQNNEIYRTDTVKNEFGWNETSFLVNTYVPMNFSKGRYFNFIRPRLQYNYNRLNPDKNAHSSFPEGGYHIAEAGLYMYRIMNRAPQQLNPRFGVVFDASYARSIISNTINFGSIYGLASTVYLPGIHLNHSISLYHGFQQKQRGQYAFTDKIRYPRGHTSVLNDQMYSFRSDYRLPLFYPDYALGGLAYFKRISLSMFYDFAIYSGTIENADLSSKTYQEMLQSAGIEVKTDLNLLRFIAPIELGFRSSYLFDGNFRTELLYSIQFNF